MRVLILIILVFCLCGCDTHSNYEWGRPKDISQIMTRERALRNNLPLPIPPDPKLAPKSHYSDLHWRITYYVPNGNEQIFTMPDHWVEYTSRSDGKYHSKHELQMVIKKDNCIKIKSQNGNWINITGNHIVEPCCKQCVNFPHENHNMERFTCKCGRKY